MLRELIIRNLAIIDELTVTFSKGLNILSGETGAGKSIIVNAINLVQGRRASADIVRDNEEDGTVEALFDISDDDAVFGRIDSLGIDREENLIIKRVISHSAKNRVFINGGFATLGMLTSVGDNLVTVSGQYENQLLLNNERHIDILDEFGDLLSLREQVGTLFDTLVSLRRELKNISLAADKRREKESLLDFQYNEIESVNLKAGEDKELIKEKNILLNGERLLEYSNHAYDTIYGSKGSAIENLNTVKADIKKISSIDSSLRPLYDTMESCIIELEDMALSLRDYTGKIEFDPAGLEEVELRLADIGKLKKKYGSTIDEILKYKDEIEIELNNISQGKDNIVDLGNEIDVTEREVFDLARDLSGKRSAAADRLKAGIEKELSSIGMENTVFEVDIENYRSNSKASPDEGLDAGDCSITGKGIDRVEFLLSPNPGESPKGLSRIASGGELSRVILALKSILARKGGVETMIFDEVDAGIGGRIADIVGRKLKSISKFHQVICITHLPQIAKFADTHYSISKMFKEGRTVTSVKTLDKEERVGEIARMLAGAEITTAVKEHAREMIEHAGKIET